MMNAAMHVVLAGVLALGGGAVPGVVAGPAEDAADLAPLLGAWSGTATHDGESQVFAMEVEPADEGKVLLRLTIPVMNLAHLPIGAVEPRIEGRQVQLGPLSFTWDPDTYTLAVPCPRTSCRSTRSP